MKQRALTIFRCASNDGYYAMHASELPPLTRELVELMRACGRCSSWGWHAESSAAYEAAKALIGACAREAVSIQQSAISRKNPSISSNGVGDRARVAGVSSPESTVTLGGSQSAQVTLPFDGGRAA